MYRFATFTVAAGLSLAALQASAATLDAGTFQVTGTYSSDDAPVTSDSTVTAGNGLIVLTTGDYAGLGTYDGTGFSLNLDGSTPTGSSFSAILDGETLTFTVSDILSAEITGSDDNTYYSVTGELDVYDGTTYLNDASFVFTSPTTSSSGTYALSVTTPSEYDASPVPVPGAGILLLGGLGGLGTIAGLRRRRRTC